MIESHIIPDNDMELHIRCSECPCHPLLDEVDGFYTHNAWDCREAYERMSGKGKPGKGWTMYEVEL